MMANVKDDPPFRLTNNTNNCITFKDVYYNGFHALKQLQVENLTQEPIKIQLDSNLKDQLAFQLENENIKDLNMFTTDMATNTAAWATFTAAPQDHSQFNQVFNYINHTGHIQLTPNEKRLFVLAFLPTMMDDQQQQACSATTTTTTAVFSTVTGTIFFCSDKYSLDIDFNATVCQSILAADELDTGLIFEDSLVGETYIKDITIRNKSAIDLYWRLNTLDLMSLKNKTGSNPSVSTNSTNVDDWLQFVDASSFIKLDHDQMEPIPPFSHYTFRVIFTPKEVGKFNYDLQIENRHDVRNIIQTKIHATMRTFMHRDTLVVSSGNILDFGDCVSGSWNMQQIVLNNISESPIEIHFIADGAELGFDIMPKLDEDEEQHHAKQQSSSVLSTNQIFSPIQVNISSKSSGITGGDISPSSSDASLTHPESPTTSHKTFVSIEEFPSPTNSYASTEYAKNFLKTDVDHIDMLTAFNEVYSNNNSPSSVVNATAASSCLIKQVTVTTEQCNTKIEFMVLKPGVERVIQVSYRPSKDEPFSVHAGQFIRQNFNIMLEYRPNKSAKPKELKLIQCKARTCTSFVQVTPQTIDFGDTDVGTQKSFPLKIINQSDICARVELVFESKVLNCTQGEISMQPRSTVELKLDIYPRKVNTFYKRQITLANYLNRDNDQIIEVSSTNVDKHRVTFHSLFYRILTPTGANFLDFGPIALNSPAIRTCTIANIRDASLLLGISTSSEHEIVIYTKKKKNNHSRITTPPSEIPPPENMITPSVTDMLLAKNRRTRMTNVQYTSTAYLDLATVPHIRFSSIKHKRYVAMNISGSRRPSLQNGGATLEIKKTLENTRNVANNTTTDSSQQKRYRKKKQQQPFVGITGTTSQLKKVRKKIMDWPDIAGKSRVPLDDLISVLEHGSLSRTPLFARQSLEEQFVRYQLAWRTELDRLIEKGELVPTSLLQLNPKEEEEIIIVYTPKISSQSLTSKNTASISVRLIDFDQYAMIISEEEEDEEEEERRGRKSRRYYKDFIPVLRKVIVRAQVCRSSMELGQKNINFGITDRAERHHKTIVLHNKSETPLLYTIKKSGSIASGDIHFGVGRHGVVRAFGKREIDFTFEPTLPGSFMEQLEVINIRDKEDKNTISLKAMVRRPESFTIKSSTPELIFNTCFAQQQQQQQQRETIIVTNTNKQSRMFEVCMDADDLQQQHYKVEFFIGHGRHQQNEVLLSKDEEEEIENLEQKLKIATRKNQPEKIEKYNKKLAKLRREDDLTDVSCSREAATTTSILLKQKMIEEDSILFSLDPNASKIISVWFKAKTNTEGQIVQQKTNNLFIGRIIIHEHKNIDKCKVIPFSVNLCMDHGCCS